MSQDPAPAQASSTFAPVSPEERIALLDVLRGVALLGILIMNMPWFSAPWSSFALEPRLFPGWHDRAATFVTELFIGGKANSIFSFLFGLGMTLQLQRAAASGGGFALVYLRRIAVLFAIGAAHALLLWNGDVLHMYAILGLLLLAVRRASDRLVLTLIVLSLVVPTLRWAWGLYTQEQPPHPMPYFVQLAHEHMRVYQQGTYLEQVAARVGDYKDWYGQARQLQGAILGFPLFAITMLLGFYVGRRRVLEDVPANAAWIRRTMWWCLGLGLLAAAGFATLHALYGDDVRPTVPGFIGGLLFNLNRPLLCIAYVGAIALLFQRDGVRRLLQPLVSVGRMPLTNYLMQTLIATTLFNSYGFALYGKVGPALGLAITAAIYAAQVVTSNWWMARFRFGPMEWLWRAATYGKLPPMRARRALEGAPAAMPAGCAGESHARE